MKRFFIGPTIIVASLIATGCVTPTPNMLHSEQFRGQVVPEPGKALVIFMRPREAAFPIHASVHDGDQFVGIVPYNQKLPYQAEPGVHTFMVISEAADFMTADLVAGRTYYAQVVPRMGAWRARFSLWAISREDLDTVEFKQWIEEGHFITNKASAYEWEEKTRGSIMFKKEAYYPKWLTKSDDLRPHLKAEDGIYQHHVIDIPVIDSGISGVYSSVTTGNLHRVLNTKTPQVRLNKNGNTITGTLPGGGEIWGDVVGNTVKFDWVSGGNSGGNGEWIFNPESKEVVGKYFSSWLGSGDWNLTKIK